MNDEPGNCHDANSLVTGDFSGYFDIIAYEIYREHDIIYNQKVVCLKYPKLRLLSFVPLKIGICHDFICSQHHDNSQIRMLFINYATVKTITKPLPHHFVISFMFI